MANCIAKDKKAHLIGERVMKLNALEITERVWGIEQRKKLEVVPLSNDTISFRITDTWNK